VPAKRRRIRVADSSGRAGLRADTDTKSRTSQSLLKLGREDNFKYFSFFQSISIIEMTMPNDTEQWPENGRWCATLTRPQIAVAATAAPMAFVCTCLELRKMDKRADLCCRGITVAYDPIYHWGPSVTNFLRGEGMSLKSPQLRD